MFQPRLQLARSQRKATGQRCACEQARRDSHHAYRFRFANEYEPTRPTWIALMRVPQLFILLNFCDGHYSCDAHCVNAPCLMSRVTMLSAWLAVMACMEQRLLSFAQRLLSRLA